MYCNNCGAWCDDDAAFCSVCGCRLQGKVPADAAQNQPYYDDVNSEFRYQNDPYQPLQYQNTYDQPRDAEEMPEASEEPEEPGGSKTTTIVAIVLAVLLVIVLAVIAVVVIGKGGGAETDSSESEVTQSAHTAQISAFTAESCNANAVVLTIEGSGYQPEGWRIVLTPESGAAITKETTERSVIIDGLTPQTNYTAVLKTTDDTALTGSTECSFTTAEYTVLTAFQADSVTTEQAVLSWSWTGTNPASWTVTWNGSDGSTGSLEAADASCTMTGLMTGVSYSVSLSCDSLQDTELSTISVTPELLAISGWNIIDLSSTSVSVSWGFSGSDNTPAQWTLRYTCGDSVEPVTVDTATNNGVIVSDLLPNTTYTFTVVSADGAAVSSEQAVHITSDGGSFTEYGCRNVYMSLYGLDSETDSLDTPTTLISTSQLLGYMIEATYDVTSADKTVSTLYIIRKSNGEPLYSYSSSRSWGGDWETANHTGTFPDHITEPGDYTLEAYFNGAFMASQNFTVQ